MGRQWYLVCGLRELLCFLNNLVERSGIDPTVAIFASAALPVKRPSEWSENRIEVPSCNGPACGCSPSCDCKPECHCEGPSEGSEKSIKAERKGILPKLVI